jgi:cell division protein FtsN
MPSREPELYKDKIEVSLDGRQIFYLFFGGAVIVGLVFVLGVLVGRRVEARGHLDRADTQSASDPLAALDRLERSDNLSFHGTLTGSEPTTDVEKAIGELEKRRAHADRAEAKPDGKPETRPEARTEAKPDRAEAKARPEAKTEARTEARTEAKTEAKPDRADAKSEAKSETKADRSETDRPHADKHDGDKKSRKHDDKPDKPVTRPDARSEAKPDARSEAREAKPQPRTEARSETKAKPSDAKGRFTLQLSSFQDRAEAEAFLGSMKSAGYQPYLTEADVTGRGTFYRVRLGSFRSVEAANDAKAEYEKAAKKSAQVMPL